MITMLSVSDLHIDFGNTQEPTHVLRGVDLTVERGQTVGLVGESGCGKSTTMLAIAGLLPTSAVIVSGSISLEGQELLSLTNKQWRSVRGGEIGCMFQNALNALHPMLTVGTQAARAYRLHHGGSRSAARREAVTMMAEVGLPDPEHVVHRYPHQLSGGQAQRAMIAVALITRPKVMLADEPTSGLDVTVQRQVLKTLVARAHEQGTTTVIVSHNLDVIRETCERVHVMYAGEIIESGQRDQVLDQPTHPYTIGLLASLRAGNRRMGFIPGTVPDLRSPIVGCPFAPRCPYVISECRKDRPYNRLISEGHHVRCIVDMNSVKAPLGVGRGARPC